MFEDPHRCLAALRARDPRFDGWFYAAVTSTGIYCRPSCPALPPRADNVRFYPSAAAAQAAGFRACKRCRPDAVPGSPAWDHRGDLVARAMRLIADGVVDREGVEGLARRLGYSRRQLQRQLVAEVGAGPLALARARRADTARTLIETTDLPFSQVAFAAGFSSLRQFNDTIRRVFAASPTQLRRRVTRGAAGTPGAVTVRLPVRRPAALPAAVQRLAARAVPGLEEVVDGRYRRALRLPRGHGVVDLHPADDHVVAVLRLDDLRDLSSAVARCRRLLDLDADPVAVGEQLAGDRGLAPLVRAMPGVRVTSSPDPFEAAVRVVLGQQIGIAAARTLTARLVTALGRRSPRPVGGVTHGFPTAAEVVDGDLRGIGLTGARAETVRRLAAAVVSGAVVLDPGVDRGEARATLARLRGIGPWTVELIAMRALHDPDAFPVTDLAVRRAARRLGLGRAQLVDAAVRWRPWRAYAAEYLWLLDGGRLAVPATAAGPATGGPAGAPPRQPAA